MGHSLFEGHPEDYADDMESETKTVMLLFKKGNPDITLREDTANVRSKLTELLKNYSSVSIDEENSCREGGELPVFTIEGQAGDINLILMKIGGNLEKIIFC